MNKRSYLYLLLLLLPLLLWRDFTPNNELRYLTIADEALRNHHFFTFTYQGEPYADKPPLYLWLVMACRWLTGEHLMGLLALFSLIPALLTVHVMDGWVSTIVSERGRKAAGYALMTTGLFLGAGIVVRMDMLMTLFIVLTLRKFYDLYKNNYTRWDKLLIGFYLFMGLFTKGIVGLLLPVVVMVVFLAIKGELRLFFKKYMGYSSWLVLLGLSAIWLSAVAIEGGATYLHNLVIDQTMGRAVAATYHREPWWYYGVELWVMVAPWSLFYGVTLWIGVWRRYLRHDVEQLFGIVVGITLVLLSLSSSKLSIYLLPMLPFMSYLSVILCRRIEHRWIYFTVAIPAMTVALALPALIGGWYGYFKRQIVNVELTELPWGILGGVAALSYFGVVTLVHLKHNKLYKAIKSLGVGLLVAIALCSFSLDVLNPYLGFHALAKQGKVLANRYNVTEYGYYYFRAGNDLSVYLKHPVESLTPEQVVLRRERGNLILFLRNKDLLRNPELAKAIEQQKQSYVGNYRIVVFEPKEGVIF